MWNDISRLASQTGRDIAAAWERGDDLEIEQRDKDTDE